MFFSVLFFFVPVCCAAFWRRPNQRIIERGLSSLRRKESIAVVSWRRSTKVHGPVSAWTSDSSPSQLCPLRPPAVRALTSPSLSKNHRGGGGGGGFLLCKKTTTTTGLPDQGNSRRRDACLSVLNHRRHRANDPAVTHNSMPSADRPLCSLVSKWAAAHLVHLVKDRRQLQGRGTLSHDRRRLHAYSPSAASIRFSVLLLSRGI